MKTYTIKPNELEAIHLAASKETTRYYLNGVLIESSGALIATDGHRCATLHANLTERPEESFILATADVKKAVAMAKAEQKQLGKRSGLQVVIRINKDGAALTVEIVTTGKDFEPVTNGSFTTTEIDGNFPDWRRIIPSEEENAAPVMSFNGAYMASFADMADLLTETKISQLTIKSTGSESPIRVTMPHCTEFLGVLMPMRA